MLRLRVRLGFAAFQSWLSITTENPDEHDNEEVPIQHGGIENKQWGKQTTGEL